MNKQQLALPLEYFMGDRFDSAPTLPTESLPMPSGSRAVTLNVTPA